LPVLPLALPKGSVGPYQLQAAIAAFHDEAARAGHTDWPQILALYDLLGRMLDNPMVALNRAMAAAMVHGATKGLELLDALKTNARLAGHHRLDAVRAHLLELAGDRSGAVSHYMAAAGLDRQPPGAQLSSDAGCATLKRTVSCGQFMRELGRLTIGLQVANLPHKG